MTWLIVPYSLARFSAITFLICYKRFLQYLLQLHSVSKGLYKKIMYGLSLFAVLEKLPIVEKKSGPLYPTPPYLFFITYLYTISHFSIKRRGNVSISEIAHKNPFSQKGKKWTPST